VKALCRVCGAGVEAKTLRALTGALAKHCPVVVPFREPTVRCWRFLRDVESANKTVYGHWTIYNRDKQSWLNFMEPAFASMGGRYSWSSWRLTRLYAGRSREMDHANMVGGFKPVPDWLQKRGVILDDKPSCFDCEYQQVRTASGVSMTQLELLDFKP
jgi:hypothetical protein